VRLTACGAPACGVWHLTACGHVTLDDVTEALLTLKAIANHLTAAGGEVMMRGHEATLTEAPSHASARGLTVVVTSHTGPRAIGYEWSRFAPGRRGVEAWP
jgi:hypothetical protein